MKRFWPYLVIVIITMAFWGRLFWPEPKLFYTVESLGSDIWSTYYPMKDLLARSLKSGQLPFWTKDIGTGFPALAEGQIGTFFLPNLILFYLFPTWLAWNLTYFLGFLFMFVGMYVLGRKWGLSKLAALFSGFSFTYGGYVIARVIHTSPFQVLVLLPWLFWAGELLWEKPDMKRVGLLAFVLSQMLFTGAVQWVFISMVGFGILAVFRIGNVRKWVWTGVAVALGIGMAMVQIMPTLELVSVSGRKSGLSSEAVFAFPYSLKQLTTFVVPDYFGTPKNATYRAGDGGVYWENQAYVGILPVIFLLIWIFKKNKKNWEVGMGTMIGMGLLFSLGQLTPFGQVLTLPGFNSFRVASRYLVLVDLGLVMLAGSVLDLLANKFGKWVYGIAIVMAIINLFGYGYNYHPLVDAKRALEKPQVDIASGERIFTNTSQYGAWRDVYLKYGWQDSEKFLQLKNGLYSDLNLIWGLTNVRVNTGLIPESQELVLDAMPTLLDEMAVKYVAGPEGIIENKTALDRVRLENGGEVKIIGDGELKLELEVRTETEDRLIVADSVYPAWRAWVNERPVEIETVNINQRAVVVPGGVSKVEMKFDITPFKWGMMVSLICLGVIVFGCVVDKRWFLIHN